MARIGDTVRPELGRVNYGGYLAGASQGAAAVGRGIAKAGEGVGDFLKKQKEAKKETQASQKMFESMAGVYGESTPIGRMAAEMALNLANEDIPLSKRHASASAGSNIMQMMLHKSATDAANGFRERQMQVAEGNLGIRTADHLQRAEVIRDEMARKDAADRGAVKMFEKLKTDLPQGGAGGDAGLLPGKGRMSTISKMLEGIDDPDEAAGAMAAAEKLGLFDNEPPKYGSKSISTTGPDGEAVTMEVLTIDGVPQMNQPIAQAPKGRMYPSVEDEVTKQELLARSKSAQNRIDQIKESSDEARRKIPKMAKAIKALADGNVKTGFGAQSIASLKRFGDALGLDTDVADFEELAVTLGDQVMARIGETKGAVSEKEMDLFQQFSAGPSKSVEGNLLILRAQAKALLRAQEESRVISKLQDEGATNAQIIYMIEEYRDQNPVITQSELQAIEGSKAAPPRGPLAPTKDAGLPAGGSGMTEEELEKTLQGFSIE